MSILDKRAYRTEDTVIVLIDQPCTMHHLRRLKDYAYHYGYTVIIPAMRPSPVRKQLAY